MQSLFDKLTKLANHLILLDKTFKNKKNYSDIKDYEIYIQNLERFETLWKSEKDKYDTLKLNHIDKGKKAYFSFVDEVYSESDRQIL